MFGTLLVHQGTVTHGLRVSLLIAAAVTLATADAAVLRTPRRAATSDGRVRGEFMGRVTTAAVDLEAQEN